MNNVPVPIKDNTVQKLADAIVQDVLSLMLPGSGTLITALKEFKRAKLNQAYGIFIEELRKGRVELNDFEQQEFIPIAYRLLRTSEEGVVNRNLRLLAKLIRNQIDDHDLSYEKYVTLDNAIRDLSLPEMIVLSELCKQIGSNDTHSFPHAPEHRTVTIDEYNQADFEGLEEMVLSGYPSIFQTRLDLHSTLPLLSGKGWLLPFNVAKLGGNLATYIPTKRILSIQSLIDDIDLAQEQGRSST